jgi:hypothetical protein
MLVPFILGRIGAPLLLAYKAARVAFRANGKKELGAIDALLGFALGEAPAQQPLMTGTWLTALTDHVAPLLPQLRNEYMQFRNARTVYPLSERSALRSVTRLRDPCAPGLTELNGKTGLCWALFVAKYATSKFLSRRRLGTAVLFFNTYRSSAQEYAPDPDRQLKADLDKWISEASARGQGQAADDAPDAMTLAGPSREQQRSAGVGRPACPHVARACACRHIYIYTCICAYIHTYMHACTARAL